MRFLIRILLLLMLGLAYFPASGFSAEFLRPALRIGFTDTEGSIWQDKRLLYQGTAYEFIEALSTYLNRRTAYTSGTMEENLLRLKSGSIDMIILPDGPMTNRSTDPIPVNLPAGTISVPLGESLGWLLLDENRAEMAPQISAAVKTIAEVNPFFRHDLLEKYHSTGLKLKLTPEEQAYLTTHPVIRTMISPRQAPYAYWENGEPRGVIADVIKRVESDLNIKLEVIPEESQQTMMEHLTNGDIDMVMDFYTDYNWAKAHNADLTFPYLTLNYVSVMRKDRPLPAAPVVACARTHFYTHQFIERMFPAEQLRYYVDVADCMAAVNRGEADITFVKSITAQSDIFRGNYYNLYTNGNVMFSHQVSMAIRDTADPILIRILNKEVTHINPRDITSIINREVYQVQAQDTLQSIIYRNPFLTLGFAVGILLLIIIGLLIFLRLRHNYTQELWQQANLVNSVGMYNIHWFTNELPNAIAYYNEARKKGELFVLIISAQRMAFLKEVYGSKLFAESVKASMQTVTRKLPWILRYGLSAEITHVYMLCRKPTGLMASRTDYLAREVEAGHDIQHVGGFADLFLLKQAVVIEAGAADEHFAALGCEVGQRLGAGSAFDGQLDALVHQRDDLGALRIVVLRQRAEERFHQHFAQFGVIAADRRVRNKDGLFDRRSGRRRLARAGSRRSALGTGNDKVCSVGLHSR